MKTPITALLASFVAAVSVSHADDFLLRESVSAAGPRLNSAAFSLEPGESLVLPSLDGENYRVSFVRAERDLPGGHVWIGQLVDAPARHRVILVEGNGALFGRIITPDGVYLASSWDPGAPVIFRREDGRVVDPDRDDTIAVSDLPSPDRPDAPLDPSAFLTATPEVGSNGVIDIGMIYSAGMVERYGAAVLTRMQYFVSLFDQALVDSETGLRANLAYAGPAPDDWAETTTTAETLDDLFAGAGYGEPGTSEDATGVCILEAGCANDGDLSYLYETRNQRAIDVMVFMRRYHRTAQRGCGIAFVNGETRGRIDPQLDHARAVAVVGDGLDVEGSGVWCSDLVMAHEVGHLMGQIHNVQAAFGRIGLHPYSYGYRIDCTFKTIMSYDSVGDGVVCPGNDPVRAPNEPRMAAFSSPDIAICLGMPCGSATSNPVTHAARSIREGGGEVQFFRHPRAARVFSAVLPYSRSVRSGATATAFMTVLNPAGSGSTARDCRPILHGSSDTSVFGVAFGYQTTDPDSNAAIGLPDTPADIPAGGAQTYVFSLRSFVELPPTDFAISAECSNRRLGDIVVSLNTFKFGTSSHSLADIIALSTTAGSTGRVDIVGSSGGGAFAVATANLGSIAQLDVSATPAADADPLGQITICRTNAATGQCLDDAAASISQLFRTTDQHTFAIFIRADGLIADDPARNRVIVNFMTPGGRLVGATSVAVRTVP